MSTSAVLRLVRRIALVTLLASAVLGIGAAGHVPPAAAADRTPTGKYYVVGEPVDGQPEFLYQIAVNTLGNGDRYPEIVELNRGRSQPGGAQFTDPLVIYPGWVLELPADAKGPGVRTGPPPVFGSSAAPVPSASTSSVPPSRVETDVDTSAATATTGALTDYLVAGLGLGVLAVLVALAGYVFTRRSTATEPTTAAPELAHGMGPQALVGVLVDQGTSGGERPDPPAHLPPPPPRWWSTEPVSAQPRPAMEVTDVQETRPTPKRGLSGRDLNTEVQGTAGPLSVRLASTRAIEATPFEWVGAGEAEPAMALPVLIGRSANTDLWIDLAVTPDLFTVTGPADASRRHVLAIGNQLRAAGHSVTVIGDVLGSPLPNGWQHLDAFPFDVARLPADAGVVISGGLHGPELAAFRQLLAKTEGRLVPIMTGKLLRARWSAVAL